MEYKNVVSIWKYNRDFLDPPVLSQIIARENKYRYDTRTPKNCTTFVSNIFSYHP